MLNNFLFWVGLLGLCPPLVAAQSAPSNEPPTEKTQSSTENTKPSHPLKSRKRLERSRNSKKKPAKRFQPLRSFFAFLGVRNTVELCLVIIAIVYWQYDKSQALMLQRQDFQNQLNNKDSEIKQQNEKYEKLEAEAEKGEDVFEMCDQYTHYYAGQDFNFDKSYSRTYYVALMMVFFKMYPQINVHDLKTLDQVRSCGSVNVTKEGKICTILGAFGAIHDQKKCGLDVLGDHLKKQDKADSFPRVFYMKSGDCEAALALAEEGYTYLAMEVEDGAAACNVFSCASLDKALNIFKAYSTGDESVDVVELQSLKKNPFETIPKHESSTSNAFNLILNAYSSSNV